MTDMERAEQHSLLVRGDRPLIGVLVEDGEPPSVCYFTDEEAAEAATASDSVQRALSLLGAWSDLDWEEALDELDRIRHTTQPTAPIDL